MPAPGPIPETVREPTFTTALGYCLSSTRGQADQRQLRRLITTTLAAVTTFPDQLDQRWVGSDSWNWWPHGSHSPDEIGRAACRAGVQLGRDGAPRAAEEV